MSRSPEKDVVSRDTFVKRAIVALPLLTLPPFFYIALTAIDSESFWSPITKREIEVSGKLFKIADAFFTGLPWLDNIWRGAVTVLTVSTLGWDGASWWQTFTFLIDVGTIYAVILLESSRRGNARTPAQLPLLFGLLFQTCGIGLTGGLYFFFLYALTPTIALKDPKNRRAESGYTNSILPLLVLFSFYPLYRSYFSDSLETRHWYMWSWQMFPLFVSVGQHLIAWLTSSGVPSSSTTADEDDSTTATLTIGGVALLSAIAWINTLVFSPYTIQQMFIPDYFFTAVPNDFTEQTRHFLKWDQVCGCGSCLLWLLYSFSDMRRAGLTQKSWFTVLGALLGLACAVGPAAAFAVGWLMRERVLTSVKSTRKTIDDTSLITAKQTRNKAFRANGI